MAPHIEVWDLDLMESVEPTIVLGALKHKKKKKKKEKASASASAANIDSVATDVRINTLL